VYEHLFFYRVVALHHCPFGGAAKAGRWAAPQLDCLLRNDVRIKKYNLRAQSAPQREKTEANGKKYNLLRIYRTTTRNNEGERKRNTTCAHLSHHNEK